MRKTILIIALLFFGLSLTAQDMESAVAYLSENIKEVSVDDEIIEQSFEKGEYECTYILSINNTSDDDAYRYEFNAGDLNEYKVAFDTKKNEIFVSLESRGGKDLIREFENDKVEGYTDELTFHATDLEHARSLTENLKALVKACTELQDSPAAVLGGNPSVNDALVYLKENIGNVSVNENNFAQAFTHDQSYSPLMKLEVTDQSKAESATYELNAADLEEGSIQFDTDREFVVIEAETKDRQDMIKVYENNELDGYDNAFSFYAANIEEARKLVEVLRFYVTESGKMKPEGLRELEKTETLKGVNEFVSALITEVTVEDETFKQSWAYQSDAPELVTLEIENVADTEVTEYSFNLSDLKKSGIEFETRGNEVIIELPSEHKYIRVVENGELQNYEDKIEIRAESIEKARYLTEGLKKAVEISMQEQDKAFIEGNPEPSQQESIDFLANAITEVTVGDDVYRQQFEVEEENNCIVLVEITDVSKGDIIVYKFNLVDINPMKVEFETSGDEVQVNLTTMGGNDLIEVIENGETDDFEDEISIWANDVEEARNISHAMRYLVGVCAEK